MKFLIASDIHGSAFYCRQLLSAVEKENPDRILLLGDLLYHGPRNDLPEGYAPKEVIPMLTGLKDRLFCVRGNCDTEVDQMVLPFPILADYCLLEEKGFLIFATHGHNYNLDKPPLLKKGDILLHGHTHVPICKQTETFTYLNPGSVSIPKEGSCHSYMTLENSTFLWKDLNGDVYNRFDL